MKIILSKSYLLFLILLLPFLEPTLFSLSDINKIFFVWKAVSVIIISFLLIKRIYKLSKISLIIIFYETIILFSTIINKGNIFDAAGDALAIIALCILIENGLIKFGKNRTLKPIILIFLIYSIINLIDVFINFDGKDVNNSFFLGMDNRFIFYFLPMICFSIITEDGSKKSRYLTITCFIISIFTIIYTWSVGALIGIIIYFIYFIILTYKKTKYKKNLFDFNKCFLIICLVNILLVVFKIQYLFSDIIINVLHKDLNLSGRTYLWNIGLKKFLQSPFIGYGINKEYLMSYLWGLNHYHNYFLNCLYQAGVIGFSIFVGMNIMTGNKIKKYNNSKNVKIISCTIIISLILSLVDTLDYPFFYVLFTLGYNANYLIENSNSNSKNYKEK